MNDDEARDSDTVALPKVMLASGQGTPREVNYQLDPIGRLADLFTQASCAPAGFKVAAFREAIKALETHILRRVERERE